MAVDTVKLRSPEIDEGTAVFLERQCILKQGVELATGEVLYEITTGSLEGSYDARIMFKVCREDWITIGGKPQQVPCKPFVIVECSWHKFFHGQNVYGNPTNFQELARLFINLLGEIMGSDHGMFADASKWQVRRVDWAEVFHLSPAAQREFFRSFRDVHFPRRAKKEARYDSALHFPGKFYTLRIYSKGPEFKVHGAAVLRKALVKRQQLQEGQAAHPHNQGQISKKVVAGMDRYKYINRKVEALQRLANWRLRFEVQINADKLHHDFNSRYPLVSEIDDKYLIVIYKEQIFKLFKEGKSEMETVRTHDQVHSRLNSVYGKRSSNNLMAFWLLLSTRGEEATKDRYSRSQFYDNRKKLVDAGISWHSTDVFIIPQDTALPRDFFPIQADPRRCIAKVSANSIFNFCPVEQHQLLKAA
ncbi:phage/plasmid replication protein, II/X family [Azovibrio restrictus]|uniref:phage/plasmid replication protein, II/X family n=1 Tax=Azovibrio restrictus TaxID=146938 RepID=UPI0026ED8464|nr:phage/plasmid replication protein, II/X family [Azovibrio restrictus]MDD3482989.1 phage/plasmid replication protein, II/X family [Azovibrio restrictus]